MRSCQSNKKETRPKDKTENSIATDLVMEGKESKKRKAVRKVKKTVLLTASLLYFQTFYTEFKKNGLISKSLDTVQMHLLLICIVPVLHLRLRKKTRLYGNNTPPLQICLFPKCSYSRCFRVREEGQLLLLRQCGCTRKDNPLKSFSPKHDFRVAFDRPKCLWTRGKYAFAETKA